MDVLDQQYQMIMHFKGLDDRFQPFAREALFQEKTIETLDDESQRNTATSSDSAVARFPESSDLLRMALDFTEKTRKFPKRLRWVVSDRAKMENLLSRLAGMNDFLRDMLDSYRGEMLRTQQIRTNYDIIQLNTKMDQLIEIIKAGSSPAVNTTLSPRASLGLGVSVAENEVKRLEPSPNSDSMHHLVKLAQFKAVACAVQGHNLDGSVRSKIGIAGLTAASQNKITVETGALDLDVPETMLSAQETVARRVTGWYNPLISNQARRRIWVEWIVASRDPRTSANGPEPRMLRRFEALVSLLRENEVTAQFRAPKCLGYYQQRATVSKIRYGLVFEIPSNVHSDSSPVSLRDLIADKDRPTPSLTSRVRLMRTLVECVEKLHAVDWLHKGLRSDNIIFFHGGLAGGDSNKGVDLSEPYLTGFDYSRPAGSSSMSEGPGISLADDLYRHPNVQGFNAEGAAGRGFRKRHDVYSLGLVLTEVAYWKPLESILGFGSLQDLKAKDVLKAREVLSSQSHTESLQSRVGDAIARASRACLEGLNTSGQRHKDGDDTVGAEHLQVRFYEAVVRPLSALVI
ncbi:hypothetical protein INS49_005780 [Diaporthe citri]|uniref:uncharacterized protein n=1 Tax=Diaporthe citri TaxID=83186 RepID=UPI001C7FBFF3|nr:uncharacterized protein INS49_005780 [Diaporthe citri]KAG6364182.1 hypothetical protein INS49_005780 [Diaporthe citri]